MRYSIPLVVFLSCVPAFAQTPSDHGWIDLDVVRFDSVQGSQTFTHVILPPTEFGPQGPIGLSTSTFTETAIYPGLPSIGGLNIGGGVAIRHRLGAAIHFDAVNYSSVAGTAVTVTVPDSSTLSGITPFTGIGTSAPLERRERAVDMSVVYTLPLVQRLSIRVFGGPTYFRVTNDMVAGLAFSARVQTFPVQTQSVNITSASNQEVSGSAWGLNVGADVTVPLMQHLGVGAVVRFNRGTVAVPEPFSSQTADLKVSRAQIGGGLRLWF